MPRNCIANCAICSCRPVSKRSGNTVLIVTLWATADFDNPFNTPVRPRRGPCDMLISGFGDFTIADEIATMRPKPRCCIPSSTRCTNSNGEIIVR